MTLHRNIELPPSGRPVGGLLAAARPMPAGWEAGVVIPSNGCRAPLRRGPCEGEFGTAGPQEDVGTRPDANASFAPVTIRQGVECSTLNGGRLVELAEQSLDATREWALARTLQTGDWTEHGQDGSSVNPALVDATSLATGVTVVDGLACLEQSAADELFGRPAFIHASPLLAPHLLGAPGIFRDGRVWRTATGNTVVFSPGYQGADLYITAEVYAATGFREVREDVDRSVNTATAWADEVGIAVFDPCWSGRVTVNASLCGA